MAPTAVLATEFDESEEVVEETVESSPEAEEEIVEEEEIIEEDSSSEEEEETVDQKDSEETKQLSKEGKIKVEASSESENIIVRAWLDEKNIDNPEEVTMNVTDIKRLNKKDSESKEKKELLEEAEEAIGEKLGTDIKAEEGFQVEFKLDNKTIEPKEEIQLEVELKTPVKKDGEEEWSLWTYGHESSEEVTKDTKAGIKNSEEKTLENASNQIQTLSFPIQENNLFVLSSSNSAKDDETEIMPLDGEYGNINGFLSELYIDGQKKDSGSKIQLNPNADYTFKLEFKEREGHQFPGNFLVYELPEGMELGQFSEPKEFELELPDTILTGNTY